MECWPCVHRDPQETVTCIQPAKERAMAALKPLPNAFVIAFKIHQVCEEEAGEGRALLYLLHRLATFRLRGVVLRAFSPPACLRKKSNSRSRAPVGVPVGYRTNPRAPRMKHNRKNKRKKQRSCLFFCFLIVLFCWQKRWSLVVLSVAFSKKRKEKNYVN